MINLIGELIQDWRRLDERIAAVSTEIEALDERSKYRPDRLQCGRGGWRQAAKSRPCLKPAPLLIEAADTADRGAARPIARH
jgi:hypothetical protein